MITWLLLGFGIGMRHALEADHLAAVASLSARSRGRAELLGVAGAWGIGHALTILALAVLWVATGVRLSEAALSGAEALAGALLVWLGWDLLRRRDLVRVRFQTHQHHDGTRHFHAHRPDSSVAEQTHCVEHPHVERPLRRALGVGAMHGLAGSALLGLFATQGVLPGRVVPYAFFFGLGATVGMLLLSAAVSLPLRAERVRTFAFAGAGRTALGGASICVGLWIGVQALWPFMEKFGI